MTLTSLNKLKEKEIALKEKELKLKEAEIKLRTIQTEIMLFSSAMLEGSEERTRRLRFIGEILEVKKENPDIFRREDII